MRDLSNNQVNKAGRVLRKAGRGEVPANPAAMSAGFDTLLRFRAAHQLPLSKTTMGLRSVVKTERCEKVEVSQRLKRIPTIYDKLQREPTLALSTMQDIGGCRAVLASIDEVRRVEARLRKNRPAVIYNDYIARPRASGYRGVHIVVTYDERRIEVQLRTQVMHAWAITVERLSGRIGQNLRGDGEPAIQALLEAISRAMALEETGMTVDGSLLEELQGRRVAAAPYIDGGQR